MGKIYSYAEYLPIAKVPGFPMYSVDANGVIFNTATKRIISVKLRDKRNDYPIVELYKEGRKYKQRQHRLVLGAFEGFPNGLVANHKNGIKHDNRLKNLEWVTTSENLKHSRRVLNNKGRDLPVAQYTLDGVFIKVWSSFKEAGKASGLKNGSSISMILKGGVHKTNDRKSGVKYRKTAGGFIWKNPTEEQLKILFGKKVKIVE